MKEDNEQNQEMVGFDIPNGLHEDQKWLKYPQKFVKSPQSLHPSKSPNNGKDCNPEDIMEICYPR